MKVTQAFEGNFIQALHGTGNSQTLEVEGVDDPNTIKSQDGRMIDRPILRFTKTDKGLILNKTNSLRLGLAWGNEMDNWKGKQVTLYRDVTDSFGKKDVPCVRVAPVESQDWTDPLAAQFAAMKGGQ